jgi:hypothetical protein
MMAATLAVTACSPHDSADIDSEHSTVQASSVTPSSTTSADAPSKGATADQSTAQGAVATWVTEIIQDRPKKVCLIMGTPATGTSPARANTAATCGGNGTTVQQMKDQIHSLHASFTPEPSTPNLTVSVAKVPVTGKTAVVTGDQVNVNGRTLTEIVLSHSTGVQEGDVGLKIDATHIDGSWYVTNLHLSVG